MGNWKITIANTLQEGVSIMNFTKFVSGIVIIIGFVVIAVVVSSLFKNIEQQNTTKTMTSSKEEHPNYPEIQVITEKANEKLYSVGLRYPQFHQKKLNKEVNAFIDTAKKDFFHDVEKNKKHFKHQEATLSISSDTQKFMDDMYSVVLRKKSSIKGEKNEDVQAIFLLDNKNHTYIEQTDILQDTEDMRDALFHLLQQAFLQSDKYKENFSSEELEKWVNEKNNDFSNMYLLEQSAVFSFTDKKIIDKEANISIPLTDMQDILTDAWKAKVSSANLAGEETKSNKKQREKQVKHDTVGKGKAARAGEKRVALTFDDGPHPENTPKVLELLKQYDAKATFFMQGDQVEPNAHIAKRVRDEGHEIGNHTWSHKRLTDLNANEIKQEVEKANKAVQKVTGETPKLFRPPYARTNDTIEQIAGLPTILWSVDTRDWESRDPVAILSEVQSGTTDGAILLMHDVHAPTVEGLKLVLDYLDGEGYEFVTVSEIRKG